MYSYTCVRASLYGFRWLLGLGLRQIDCGGPSILVHPGVGPARFEAPANHNTMGITPSAKPSSPFSGSHIARICYRVLALAHVEPAGASALTGVIPCVSTDLLYIASEVSRLTQQRTSTERAKTHENARHQTARVPNSYSYRFEVYLRYMISVGNMGP